MYTVTKVIDFSVPSVMSPTKLSLVGNNLIFPGMGELGLGTGKMANYFLQCIVLL
jgi:hypothetical protein